jgi:hypothetical protein
MIWIAKPYLNRNTGMKEFADAPSAVKYLEDFTGYKMDVEVNRKTKERNYGWELCGKLFKKVEKSAGA